MTGRYTRKQLLELAEQADAGFECRILADLLACWSVRRFAAHDAEPGQIEAMWGWFRQWREELLTDPT